MFFFMLTFFYQLSFKNSFRNTIIVSNGLDPDQDRHAVGPDLGSNCLQRLSVDDENRHQQGKSYGTERKIKINETAFEALSNFKS